MQNINKVKNPVIQHIVSMLRDISVQGDLFRSYVSELARLLLYEALKDENLHMKKINTWIGEKEFPVLNEKNLIPIAILRAGLPMLEGVLKILKNSPAGFLAIKRDEKTLKSTVYYVRLPDIEGKTVIIVDPMVATGGSLDDAIKIVKERKPKKIITLNIIAAPEGIERISKNHPDVKVYIAQIDEKLNKDGFIIPGLGDAGDRAFNT